MTPERWQQVKHLLESALERDPRERTALIDEACKDDPQLKLEVESLIASHEEARSLFDSPPMQAAASLLADDRANLIGRNIGHFKILAELGRGGMGEVFLAQDARLGRRVALKLLPVFYTRDEERLRRFELEARSASALNHPNIVTIFEVGELEGLHFIATELVEGETLRGAMKHARMNLVEMLDVCSQAANALAAAHVAGIVHRDIKPENIMLRPDRYVKVLDFGLAKLTEARSVTGETAPTVMRMHTDPGTIVGTAYYMSPEQARGLPVDARTDIFSLGAVLYEMVTGRLPFQGETSSDVVASILKTEPPPLSRFVQEVPPELQRIVSKALRKDREERYQSVRDLMVDLRSLKQDLEIEAKLKPSLLSGIGDTRGAITRNVQSGLSTGGTIAVETAEGASLTKTSSAEIIITEIKRHKKAAVATIVGVVVLLIVAGLAVYRIAGKRNTTEKAASPQISFKMSRLTTTGKASIAAISPDGKYVAHAMGAKGQQSLWLRHIATGSDTEIVPTAPVHYDALTFSADGNYIYFLRWESVEGAFYRVPVLGGSLRMLGRDIDGGITFSPDGRQIAYVRGFPQRNEATIVIAGADGSEERKLVTHSQKDMFPTRQVAWGPAWSPGGDVIAFATGNAENAAKGVNIFTARVVDSAEQQITHQQWRSVGQMAWLSDGSGLIVTVADNESYPAQQIWQVSYPSGEARRVTNDTNDYSGVSLNTESTAAVTVQTGQTSNIWLVPGDDVSRATQITSTNFEGLFGVCWTPDERILFTRRTRNGRSAVWIMNSDGSDQKQLTTDTRPSDGASVTSNRPAASPDGRYFVFTSDLSGDSEIWRIDSDGSNPRQLTNRGHAGRPQITPDSQSVIFTDSQANRRGLWKVSKDGGDPLRLTDYTSNSPAVSPDGKQIALRFVDEHATPPRWRLAIIPAEGGAPAKVLDLPLVTNQMVQWVPDGRALICLDIRNGVSNIWMYPVDGNPPKQLTYFKTDQIFAFARSSDGKQLVCARGNESSDVVMINVLK